MNQLTEKSHTGFKSGRRKKSYGCAISEGGGSGLEMDAQLLNKKGVFGGVKKT